MFGSNDRYVIGYDLTDEYAQISYMKAGDEDATTLSLVEGEEKYHIPVCLFKRKEVNQWFFAKEAFNYEKVEEGTLFTDLLSKAIAGEEIRIMTDVFNPVALLALFFKRSLSLLNGVVKRDKIAEIMITVEALNARVIEVLTEMVMLLDMKDCHISFEGREESIFYYVIHQNPKLWMRDVAVFDLSSKMLNSFLFKRNQNTSPQVVFIDRKEHAQITSNDDGHLDEDFLQVIQEYTQKNTITGVYLIGDGFMENWYEASLRELCQGRRVFQGNNLYSKGACFGALAKQDQDKKDTSIVFLGKDKLKVNVGIHLKRGRDDSYLALLNGGENWYDSKKECDVILLSGNSFTISITPLNGKNIRYEEMVLEGLPAREEGTTRLHIEVSMSGENTMQITVRDMGFGEIFPGTGQVFEQEINLIG